MEATFALYIPLPHVALECEDYPRFLGLFLFYQPFSVQYLTPLCRGW